MQSTWLPIPRSLREAVYLAIAIILATTHKRIGNALTAFWRTFKTAPAEAAKTYAEAEQIQTQSVVSTAQLIREMSINLGQATLMAGQLKEKVVSQQSQLNLKDERIRELERIMIAAGLETTARRPSA